MHEAGLDRRRRQGPSLVAVSARPLVDPPDAHDAPPLRHAHPNPRTLTRPLARVLLVPLPFPCPPSRRSRSSRARLQPGAAYDWGLRSAWRVHPRVDGLLRRSCHRRHGLSSLACFLSCLLASSPFFPPSLSTLPLSRIHPRGGHWQGVWIHSRRQRGRSPVRVWQGRARGMGHRHSIIDG